MSQINRRRLLKTTLLAAVGLARKHPLFAVLASASPADVLKPGAALKAGRWAMVIDLKKCLAAKDCHDACIQACRDTHNIPDLANQMHEIKWIWRETGERVFPGQLDEYRGAGLARQPVPALCNHCANPPCTGSAQRERLSNAPTVLS